MIQLKEKVPARSNRFSSSVFSQKLVDEGKALADVASCDQCEGEIVEEIDEEVHHAADASPDCNAFSFVYVH